MRNVHFNACAFFLKCATCITLILNVTVDMYDGQNKKTPYIFQEMINLVYNGIYNNLPVAEDGIYMILPQFKYFSHTNSTSISSQSFSHGRGNISF